MRLRPLLFIFWILLLVDTASATSTFAYDSNSRQQYSHIFVNESGNTLNSVYTDIANSSLISKNGNNYTVNCDIFIEHGAKLIIDGENLTFGNNLIRPDKPLRIWNKGSLQINNSTITSTDSDSTFWGYIHCRNLEPDSDVDYWYFNLTNSTLDKLGSVNPETHNPYIDEYSGGVKAIYLGGAEPVECNTSINIRDNTFIQTNGVRGGLNLNFRNNYITDSTYNAVFLDTGDGAQVYNNVFQDNVGAYKLIIDWGAGNVSYNRFINNTLLPGGMAIDLKEGSGGAVINNNIIDGGSYSYALSLSGSTHSKWSVANNNKISNINGIAILIQGNGYNDPNDNPDQGARSDVLVSVENNTLTNVSCGIQVMGIGNFGVNFGPRHVLTRNNVIDSAQYGYIFYNAISTKNVTLINDTIKNCSSSDLLYKGFSTEDNIQPKIVDLNYVTKTRHVAFNDNYGTLLEYKSLNWSITDQNSNPISANVSITNNVNALYPVVYYNDTRVSPLTNISSVSAPAIMLVRKGVTNGVWGQAAYQNMSYSVNITKSGFPSYNITVTAEKDGYTSNTTGVNPDETWYRVSPNIQTNTITIVLPYSSKLNLTASAGADQTKYKDDEFTFNGSESTSNNKIISYEWDFNSSDGIQKDAVGPVVRHIYDTAGVYTVTLTIIDSNDNIDSDTCLITVLDNTVDTPICVSPSLSQIIPGKTFTVDILVNPSTPITGAQFDLSYKDSMVKVNGVKESSLFSQNGASTYFSNGTVNSREGLIRHIYGSILGESSVSSPGTLAVINLTANNSTGIAEFNLSNVIISDVNSSRLSNSVKNSTTLIDTAPELDLVGSKSVDETKNLTFRVGGKDADGDKLVFSASGLPNGAIFDPATGVFTWIPSKGQAGAYIVAFKVSDGYLDDSEDVEINVNTPNNAPSITSFEPANGAVFNEGDNVTIALNASDADGQALSYVIKIDGTVYSTSPGYVWNTDYSSSGSHTIELTASDGIEEVKKVNTIYINDIYPRWDVNKDGMVNIRDVTMVSRKYGTITKAPYPNWDVNQDGIVNMKDLDIVNSHFGEKVE